MDDAPVERRVLGWVEVDSGTLIIGDPAYVLPNASDDRPGVDYQEVIDADSSQHAMHLAGTPVLLLQRFGGDGTFPVLGEFVDGELLALRIDLEPFADDKDEEDEEDDEDDEDDEGGG